MDEHLTDTEQPTPAAATSSQSAITGIAFVSAYVDDYQAAYAFYADLLGLEKQFDMGPDSCFFKLGSDLGLYLEGGNNAQEVTPKSVRGAFTLSVPSAGALFAKLSEAGVPIIQQKPMDMSQGNFWFQFRDPSGNILEALGGE